jgi:hypothetical protein
MDGEGTMNQMEDEPNCSWSCSGIAEPCTPANAWQLVLDFAELVLSDDGDEGDLDCFPHAIEHWLAITRRWTS